MDFMRSAIRPFAPFWLVILSFPIDAKSAEETIRCAKEKAARPSLMRFAIPQTLEGSVDAGDSELCYYTGHEPLSGAAAVITDEKFFVLLSGEHRFDERWDARLASAFRSLGQKRSLLTGSITPGSYAPPASPDAPTQRVEKLRPGNLAAFKQALPEIRRRSKQQMEQVSDHPPEVCLPAIKESPSDNEALIGNGLPLVCSSAAVPSLLIDPAFVFAPVQFLWDNTLDLCTLSLAAFITGWRVFVLNEPVFWPAAKLPRRVLRRPPPSTMPGTTLNRFEQLLGFQTGQEMVSAKAALGLFGAEDLYPQQMPHALAISQKALSVKLRLIDTHAPLMVSAFIDLPFPRFPLPFYLLRFGFLRRIQSLPLLLFTGGSQERALRMSFTHTQSYPDHDVLSRTLLSQGMTPKQHFARSKPFLLKRAARLHSEFTHIAWLDMDILPHPICSNALIDFTPIMDERIHLATVHGVPDLSFILVPVHMCEALAREAKSLTLLDAELKRDFSEEIMWERLFLKRPEWFTIHPMPRRRLLFLSVFDPRFFSQTIRPLLKNLPEPFHGTAADRKGSPDRSPKPFKE